jgi:predicted ArsR family transcriptional regulator
MSDWGRDLSDLLENCSNNHIMSEKRADMPERRQQRIVELIRKSGGVTVAGLEEELGVSPATARRDLAVLERQRKLRKTHGGAGRSCRS